MTLRLADPSLAFAAPTDTISDQTGILATDVTAPVTVLPDATNVTQPTVRLSYYLAMFILWVGSV
jgi:hypothetical protein